MGGFPPVNEIDATVIKKVKADGAASLGGASRSGRTESMSY